VAGAFVLLVGAGMAFAGNALRQDAAPPAEPPAAGLIGVATLIEPGTPLTRADSIDVEGTLPPDLVRGPDSTIVGLVNGEQAREQPVPTGDGFAVDDVPISEGENEITVFLAVDDRTGPPSLPITVTRDTTAPDVRITRPEPGITVYGGRETLRGRTEAGATIEIYEAGNDRELSATITTDGRFEAPVELAMGENDFTLRSVDAAGNRTTVHHVITRDVTLASITLSASVAELTLADLPAEVTFTTNVRDEQGARSDGATVTFSLSPPNRETTTYQATTHNGQAHWADVAISSSTSSRGTWLATVLLVLPSGEELREDVAFVVVD
jgi:hypothetical protein